MNTTKMTKRQMFEAIRSKLTDKAEIDFINHELELLAKKNASKSSKPTAKQAENAGIKEVILAFMEKGTRYQIKGLLKDVPELADFTSQRVSALMRQLKEDGLVNRIVEGKNTYFEKA